MSSSRRTVDFIVEQAAGAGVVTARKMFGEYAVYCDGKLVALVCDDALFVKPTAGGIRLIGEVVEAAPYKGAKPSLLVSAEKWDDAEWLSELIRITATELPSPRQKKRKTR